ncbi:MAG: DEAD/DEAH box helicase, partial [Ruminococcaceae bacterium]|nr:DEAD/DEAH box helicase [Oscillospiraceae bacterium]
MSRITETLLAEREYRELMATLKEQKAARIPRPARLIGLCEGARNVLVASVLEDLASQNREPVLLLVPDEKEAMRASAALGALGHSPVVYSFRDYIFYNITASHEYEHERLAVLTSILDGTCDVVITTPDAAMQYTMPKARLEAAIRRIVLGDTVELDELKQFLVRSGYQPVDMVDGPGQYSVRGGIVDIYPPGSEYPVRMELFGDDVDSMGTFDILSQRRMEPIDEIRLTPARELLIDSETRSRLRKTILAQIKKCRSEHSRDLLSVELEAIAAEADLKFSDKYLSVIYPEKSCLLDYFSSGAFILCEEYAACAERLKSYEWHQKQAISSLLEDGLIASSLADYGKWQDDFHFAIGSHPGLLIDAFMSSITDMRFAAMFSIQTKQTVCYSENFELLIEDLLSYKKSDFKVLILCENEIMAKNLAAMMIEHDLTAPILPPDAPTAKDADISITYGLNIAGFEWILSRFAVLSTYPAGTAYASSRLAKKKKKATKKSAQEKIMSYADLSVGDYVVHVNHGIGMFLGIESVTVEGITRDYIKLKYAGTDVLFLPCEQLDSISKYIGARGEDGTLKLSRMGGAEWTKAKHQVKAAAKEMAKDLIRLYAERQRRPGFAFYPDDDMQRDFEAAFPYAETDGQLVAIREVKRDMEAPRPMDRLLCGDVGFGKTEVALRAAFKAVEAGKQVAILVPTTILALQHYQTLLSRLRGFPVRCDMLSRFRTLKQQQETLRRIRRGEVDILVGTHRIVSKDVAFKDLGLVIIDEEQRFGVAAKEKLRQLASGVDTLTLTATPIPRTLNMAMSGIRDMSVLEEAPNDRVPVQTYVLEYDEVILGEAIKKELRRGGQVFYLHNRVESMPDILASVSQMAPDAHIAVAHG